jgi:hypothetical protein
MRHWPLSVRELHAKHHRLPLPLPPVGDWCISADEALSLCDDTLFAISTCDYEAGLAGVKKVELLVRSGGCDHEFSVHLCPLLFASFESVGETELHDHVAAIIHALVFSQSFPAENLPKLVAIIDDQFHNESWTAIPTLIECITAFPDCRELILVALGPSALERIECPVGSAILKLFMFLIEEPLNFDLLSQFAITVFNCGMIAGRRLELFLLILSHRPECLSAFDVQTVTDFLISISDHTDTRLFLIALSSVIEGQRTLDGLDIRAILDLRTIDPAGAYFCAARVIEADPTLASFCGRELGFVETPSDFIAKRECVRCLTAIVLGLSADDRPTFATDAIVELMIDVFESGDAGDDGFKKTRTALSMLAEDGKISPEAFERICAADEWSGWDSFRNVARVRNWDD